MAWEQGTGDEMKKYRVTIPIAGYVEVGVEVDDDADKDDIFEAAMEQYSKDDEKDVAGITWDFYEKITEGNVLHAQMNEWSYEEEEGDEDG